MQDLISNRSFLKLEITLSLQEQPNFIIDFDFDPVSTEFRFVITESTKSQNFEIANNTFKLFIRAFKFGMFSSLLNASTEESVNVIRENLDNSLNRTVEYVLKSLNVQALRVFVNLLCHATFTSKQPVSISICSPKGTRHEKIFLENIIRFPFQPWPEKTPFDLLFAWDRAISFSPVVRFSFERTPNENEVEIVEEAVNTWIDIVKNGGYKKELAFSEEIFIQDFESYQVAPKTWELALYGFSADEVSFSSLIQFAIRFHKAHCPIVCFEIQV